MARTVKRAAALERAAFAGHSLRAGLPISAARSWKTERDIMRQTRHKSAQIVRRYIREAGVFENNAAEGLLYDPSLRPLPANGESAGNQVGFEGHSFTTLRSGARRLGSKRKYITSPHGRIEWY